MSKYLLGLLLKYWFILVCCIYLHPLFSSSWQPESKFPFSQVFLPPKDTGKHTEFVENQEVEVFARSNEKEACGWWTANIKVSKPIHYLTSIRKCN